MMNRNSFQSLSNRPTPDVNRLIPLQKNLLQIWQESQVDEYYQQIILSYLDSLPLAEAEQEITKQIKSTHEGKSFYFKLEERTRQRQKQLDNLRRLLNKNSSSRKDGYNMEKICNHLNLLRDNNLGVAEIMLHLHKQYNKSEDKVSDHCRQVFMNLDEENQFLKDSILNQYILFQQGYDPFFLYHYDMKGKKAPNSQNSIVDRLFNLNISYACRLIKVKNSILDLISRGKYNFKRTFKEQDKRTPYTTIIPFEDNSAKSKSFFYEDSNQLRMTKNNFRKNTFSLQNAKEKQFQQNNRRLSSNNPIVNQQKLKRFLTQTPQTNKYHYPRINGNGNGYNPRQMQSSDDEDLVYRRFRIRTKQSKKQSPKIDEQEQYQLVPVNFRINKKNVKNHPSKKQVDTPPKYENNQNLPSKIKLSPIISHKPAQSIDSNEKIDSVKPKNSAASKKRQPLFTDEQPIQRSQFESNQSMSKISDSVKPQKQELKKEIKMRPGKYSFPQLIAYLKKLNLQQSLKTETIMNEKWKQSIMKCQSYVCEFTINQKVSAVALTMILPEGEYLIKMWGPIHPCNQQTSIFLFNKYLEYIQRMTVTKQILFNGEEIKQIKAAGFMSKKDRIYSRKRQSPIIKKEQQFQPFLSLKCSNICFSQQNLSISKLYSEQIQTFTGQNSYVNPAIGSINRSKIDKNILLLAKISDNIADMKALNSLLEDQDFDNYEVTPNIKINNINALRLFANTSFRCPFLIADGYIKLIGEEIYRAEKQLICRVSCIKSNMKFIVGKGLKSIDKLITSYKNQPLKQSELSIKMFHKQLYGRIPVQETNYGCYGNWEISLWWRDQLQGKIKHKLTEFECFGPQSFFVGIEIEGELIYCFQVKQEDFLF